MSDSHDLALIAHLMRRAGFGANRDRLEEYAARGYEATLSELLNPETAPPFDDDLAYRYYPYFRIGTAIPTQQSHWMLRMIGTPRPLEEKMTLFWHHLFATGFAKVDNAPEMHQQIGTFRNHGMGNFRTLLVELSKDPAMIFWLDNCESHKDAPNENYGRELLELFSMGVGNYTEDDVKECARAFTGWTIMPGIPRYPWGEFLREFAYRPDDHDDSEKTFLGHRGRFNGEDIIDIICRQPATGRFISRHLYNFFVAEEPQVPAWPTTPPQDPEAIELLSEEYFRSNYDIRSMLAVLFRSDFFRKARYTKVKSPAELVAGVMRLVDDYTTPKPRIHEISAACNFMGQELLNPPTVEGWHTGREWIDSGALVERINFASDQVGDLSKPGVQRIVQRLSTDGSALTPEQMVDGCLDLAGPVVVSESRRRELVAAVALAGPAPCTTPEDMDTFAPRVARLLQLIVSSREYQMV